MTQNLKVVKRWVDVAREIFVIVIRMSLRYRGLGMGEGFDKLKVFEWKGQFSRTMLIDVSLFA
jgi:hypothetical protein